MLKKKLYKQLLKELIGLVKRYNCELFVFKDYYEGRIHQLCDVIRYIYKYKIHISQGMIDGGNRIYRINIYNDKKRNKKDEDLEFYFNEPRGEN